MTISQLDFQKIQEKYSDKYNTFVVDAFLLSNDNTQILLQRRSANRKLFPLFWDAIGGHAEPGEDLFSALHREVQEETQLLLSEVIALVHSFEWENDRTVMNFQFLCRATGELKIETGKVSEARWISPSDLNDLQDYISAPMLQGIEKAFIQARLL